MSTSREKVINHVMPMCVNYRMCLLASTLKQHCLLPSYGIPTMSATERCAFSLPTIDTIFKVEETSRLTSNKLRIDGVITLREDFGGAVKLCASSTYMKNDPLAQNKAI